MKPTYSNQSKTKRIELVFDLYRKYGEEDYIGEPVSQIEHMCQSAQIAEKEGYEEEVILAAFFHDIGHLCVHLGNFESMDGYGIKSHEKIGGDFLRDLGFPEKVAKLVENHVQAKRYLTYKFPEYFDKLSEASRKTLEFQGGKMNASEAAAFENDPLFEVSLKMRTWDEMAKEEHVPLPDLENYKKMAERILAS
ncbi:phosphonate degradation HD-domain oxygenase [Algoriphagus halophilus]|uniref:Phosphonate degradation operons associated HDIG domain protein n=1 Tax=Algoriphagus halophilus TaxID=226505 RepID=A0A1N6D9N9_9BACT|nr:phosphonate degradation HD-domain oxygenase [Algoriphagus halophilus]SIN67403.1 phosphonate degradation operons associated HDIG domain protein [Algoriphagus halophilus]